MVCASQEAELLGKAEFKLEQLLERAQLVIDAPLKLPDAPERGVHPFCRAKLSIPCGRP